MGASERACNDGPHARVVRPGPSDQSHERCAGLVRAVYAGEDTEVGSVCHTWPPIYSGCLYFRLSTLCVETLSCWGLGA